MFNLVMMHSTYDNTEVLYVPSSDTCEVQQQGLNSYRFRLARFISIMALQCRLHLCLADTL